MNLVILAAGMGSRYGGLKQIEPVGPSGEIILDYAVYDAARVGATKVVFVIRKDIDKDFREAIGSRYGSAIEVDYVHQEVDALPEGFALPAGRKKPWGTAHAILTAKSAVDAPFAALNADDFYGPGSYDPLYEFLSQVDPDSHEYCMVGFTLRETLSDHGTVARGVCDVDGDGYLQEVTERTKIEAHGRGARYLSETGDWLPLTGDERVSLNMWGFTPTLFNHLEAQFKEFLNGLEDGEKGEFFIPSVVHRLIQDGKATAKVLPTEEKWYGMTYQEDRETTRAGILKLVEDGGYPTPLFQKNEEKA